jgi:DUF4097 and DUF4098 domain-containing protein YvlB
MWRKSLKITIEDYAVSTNNWVNRVKEPLHEGNATRVIVKDDAGKVLLEIPTSVGVVAALAANCSVMVERRE